MNTQKLVGSMLSVAALTVVAAGAAFANINPTNPTPVITGTGPFTYTYSAIVTSTETVNPGDFFTFYDVNGLISQSEVASNPLFVASEAPLNSPVSVTGIGTVNLVDSAAVPNVTFTYNGTASIVGMPTALGTFSFMSIFGPATTYNPFFGRATETASGSPNGNLARYLAPAPAVPEPASVIPFALGGLGLLGLIARKTRRTSGAAA